MILFITVVLDSYLKIQRRFMTDKRVRVKKGKDKMILSCMTLHLKLYTSYEQSRKALTYCQLKERDNECLQIKKAYEPFLFVKSKILYNTRYLKVEKGKDRKQISYMKDSRMKDKVLRISKEQMFHKH